MSKEVEKRFKEDSEYRMYRIVHMAKKHGWELEVADPTRLKYIRGKVILYILFFPLRCSTWLTHPKKGPTVLMRSGALTHHLIEQIFRNPRQHMPPTIKSEYQKL